MASSLTVYLCGPIEGITLEEATAWRDQARKILEGMGAKVYDPMQGKHNIVPAPDRTIWYPDYNPNLKHLTKPDAIYYKDLFTLERSDVLLVNLRSEAACRGTFFEIGYARARNKTVIVVSDSDAVTRHPFVRMSAIVYPFFGEALDLIATML